jgi:5'-3' exonuclease
MGIEKFHTWLKNTYYNSITEYSTSSYDHLYIDLNFVLHRLVSYSTSEKDLLTRAMESISTIINNNNPLKTLNLVADGSASYAKILLQKKRRLQTAQSLSTKYKDTQSALAKINPLFLTPGTQFMQRFNETIRKYVADTIGKHIIVNMNLSDEPDESEFKIGRYIIKNATSVFDTHLIFSSDADIVLISLALVNIHNVNIVIQQGRDSQTYIISIDQLLEQHMDMFGYHPLKRLDFVFLSILLGNDYFPKLRCAEFQKLWKIYKTSVKPFETIVRSDHTINIPIFHKFLNNYVSCMSKKYRMVDVHDIVHTNAEDYLYGLSWCIHLYATGNYLDYDYLYPGDSVHPRCIIQYFMQQKIHNMDNIKLIEKPCTPIPSEIYPVVVLPHMAMSLVPKKYHEIIKNKLMYMYDEEFCKECELFRQSLRNARKKVTDSSEDTASDEDSGIVVCDTLGTSTKCCKYTMKNYILHKKTHCIGNPKIYIDKIVTQLRF